MKKYRQIVYKTSGPTYRPSTGQKRSGKAIDNRGRHRNQPSTNRELSIGNSPIYCPGYGQFYKP